MIIVIISLFAAYIWHWLIYYLQEAYKATEDIHGLMNMSKKSPVPKTMANYYQKLALVFWKANNCLFHAAALFKLFQLSKEMKKNITPEELQRLGLYSRLVWRVNCA